MFPWSTNDRTRLWRGQRHGHNCRYLSGYKHEPEHLMIGWKKLCQVSWSCVQCGVRLETLRAQCALLKGIEGKQKWDCHFGLAPGYGIMSWCLHRLSIWTTLTLLLMSSPAFSSNQTLLVNFFAHGHSLPLYFFLHLLRWFFPVCPQLWLWSLMTVLVSSISCPPCAGFSVHLALPPASLLSLFPWFPELHRLPAFLFPVWPLSHRGKLLLGFVFSPISFHFTLSLGDLIDHTTSRHLFVNNLSCLAIVHPSPQSFCCLLVISTCMSQRLFKFV